MSCFLTRFIKPSVLFSIHCMLLRFVFLLGAITLPCGFVFRIRSCIARACDRPDLI